MRKLYLFTNTQGDGNSGSEYCLAMSDSGRVLASHLCSSVAFMYGDLYGNRPERKEVWEREFDGEAFEVVCLKAGELPPAEVLDGHRKLYVENK